MEQVVEPFLGRLGIGIVDYRRSDFDNKQIKKEFPGNEAIFSKKKLWMKKL